jgi:hypothetical protein
MNGLEGAVLLHEMSSANDLRRGEASPATNRFGGVAAVQSVLDLFGIE